MFIGIMGYSGVGKDTAAEAIAEDFDFDRVAFADELKREVYEQWEESDDQLKQSWLSVVKRCGWDVAKRDIPAVREYLQKFGETRRMLDERYWVRKLHQVVFSNGLTDVVIPDVRYENEAAYIDGNGGALVLLNSDDVGPVNGHPSEVGLASIPADIPLDVTGLTRDEVKALVSRAVLHEILLEDEGA